MHQLAYFFEATDGYVMCSGAVDSAGPFWGSDKPTLMVGSRSSELCLAPPHQGKRGGNEASPGDCPMVGTEQAFPPAAPVLLKPILLPQQAAP